MRGNSRMFMKGNRNKRGFSLAELLIVVAIIAVLVAIAIPIFNKQIEKSREVCDIDTMRQAASLAVGFFYAGISDGPSAEAAGLKWWDNGGDGSNAAGVYNPGSGKFSPIRSTQAKEAYGKGTTIDTGIKYALNKNREMYAAKEDYSNGVVMVSIYPSGSNKHIDVYWKDISTGKYIGGQKAANDPKYSIRIEMK